MKLIVLILCLLGSCFCGFNTVLTFAFQNVSTVNPTLIDTSFTCWTEKLNYNQGQINTFVQNGLQWYSSQYGVQVNLGLFIPGIGWLIPGFGVLIPNRFNADYRLVASSSVIPTPAPLLTACNLVLVPLPLFIPAFTLYGGVYKQYLNSRGFTGGNYIYIQLDDNLVYGAYAYETPGNATKVILNKSYLPLKNNDDYNVRSERAILEDLSGTFGTGFLYGTSNVYTTTVNNNYIYSARATWTFGGPNIPPF